MFECTWNVGCISYFISDLTEMNNNISNNNNVFSTLNLCSENVSKMKHCKETHPIGYEHLLRPHLCIVFIFYHCPSFRILLNPIIAFKKYNTSVLDQSRIYRAREPLSIYAFGGEREKGRESLFYMLLFTCIFDRQL